MKRSYVIELLSKSFFKHMNNESIENDTMLWSAVLKDLEGVGMLPPYTTFDSNRTEGHIERCIWEPEEDRYCGAI